MRRRNRFLLVVAGLSLATPCAQAWEHHPLITKPILATLPDVRDAAPVPATPLETFLLAHEAELAALLAGEEAWARQHLPAYAPRPDALAFQATGNPDDVLRRFFEAIRINPNTKTPLYLSPLAQGETNKPLLDVSEVTLLDQADYLAVFDFEALAPGDLAAPIDIAATASNEPDYGMDTGLFVDNGTAFGQYYGFGEQAFGNADLDYGTQAPFHMGFYHEAPIIFLFAGFLKETYPEARIHLYKSLSQFAFAHGEDYWGWRFMGWGLHYVADLSMPYHTTALPGHSAIRMLIIYLLDLLGWPRFVDNSMQLVSNRHMALERYQGITLAQACAREDSKLPALAALRKEQDIPAYKDTLPREKLAKCAHDMAARTDANIARLMPSRFVCDPSVELGDVPEVDRIVERVADEHGMAGLLKLDRLLAEALELFGVYGRSYVQAILSD